MDPEVDWVPNNDEYDDSICTKTLQVAAVGNSTAYHRAKHTEQPKYFSLLRPSNLEGPISWTALREIKAEDVNKWCDFETLLVGLITS